MEGEPSALKTITAPELDGNEIVKNQEPDSSRDDKGRNTQHDLSVGPESREAVVVQGEAGVTESAY